MTKHTSKPRLQRVRSFYVAFALHLFNTVLLLVFLNGALFLVFVVKDYLDGRSAANSVTEQYGDDPLALVYPDLTDQQRSALLKETWSRPYDYEPFTQFKERAYRGQYVNVSEHGFRLTHNQGAWPPAPDTFNIFIFGGSTTFGYGVADDQTIASHLQGCLAAAGRRDIRIYNFGRGHYYSAQERILYEQLLTSGHVPDMAVFVDGLNDFYFVKDQALFTDRFDELFADITAPPKLPRFISQMPMARALQALRRRVGKLPADQGPNSTHAADATDELEWLYNDVPLLERVISTYLANKKLIEAVSAAHDVEAVFVWQPVPTFNFDDSKHLFAGDGYGTHTYTRYGYERMRTLVDADSVGGNFLWLADIHPDLRVHAYVDKFHYSGAFSKLLAKTMADMMFARGLLATDRATDRSSLVARPNHGG